MKKVVLLVVLLVSLLVATTASAQAPGPGGGWWSGEQIQNVGTASGTILVTAYDMNSSSVYESSTTVDAGGAFTFLPTSFAGMPDGFVGSAIVSSDQPIKGIVNVTNQPTTLPGGVVVGVTGGKAAGMYQGTAAPSTELYFPIAKHNRYGATVGYYVQNAGTASATATAVFSMDDGGVYTFVTPSIGPGKMVYINPAMAGVPTTNTNRANVGSLKVTSAQPLAGTAMEQLTTETVATVVFAVRALTPADLSTKAYAPVVKNDRYGRFTGIQVLNTTAAVITVNINYVGTSVGCKDISTTDTITVQPGKSTTMVSNQGNFTDNCTGTATLTGTGNFVAIVNENNLAGFPLAGIAYFALPSTSTTAKVSVPLYKDMRYNATSGLQIQNVGTAAATNVVATFYCKGAATFTAVSKPLTIAAGGGFLFYKPYELMAASFATPFASTNVNCSAIVTADQPVVAIVNESSTLTPPMLDDYNYEGFNVTP